MKEYFKKQSYLTVGIMTLLVLLVGTTFAWFTYTVSQNNNGTSVQSGVLSIGYSDGNIVTTDVLMPSLRPEYNSECNNNLCYKNDFTISNTGSLDVIVGGAIVGISNTFESEKLMFNIYDGETQVVPDTAIAGNENVQLFNNIMLDANNGSKTLTLFLWLDSTATNESANKSFTGTISIAGIQTGGPSYAYYDISEGSLEISQGSSDNTILIKGYEKSSPIQFQSVKRIANGIQTEKEVDKETNIVVTGTTDVNTITVKSGNPKLILSNVEIDVSSRSEVAAISVSNTAIVDISIFGENYVASGENKAGVDVPSGARVNVIGTGSLKSIGGTNSESIGVKNGQTKGTINYENGFNTVYTCAAGTYDETTKRCNTTATEEYYCANSRDSVSGSRCTYSATYCPPPYNGSGTYTCWVNAGKRYVCSKGWTLYGSTCYKYAIAEIKR